MNKLLHWGWFTKAWWSYLFEPKSSDYSWLEVLWCRMQGHPKPVVWYNASGLEPDMTCTGCGDDLG